MKAILDFGNTRGKWALFDGKELMATGHIATDPQLTMHLFQEYHVSYIMAAKVGNDLHHIIPALQASFPLFELTPSTPLPITNRYATPQTLGMDRLAGVIGAWALFPNQASLVIDLGTCVTYDFINTKGEYLGGSIAPGMRMRAQAMQHFTAKLPMVESFHPDTPLIGNSTQNCLASGAINGLALEIEGTIQAYQSTFEIFNTVLCGGDARFFETKLKAPIFARTELVMIGLNAILDHLLTS